MKNLIFIVLIILLIVGALFINLPKTGLSNHPKPNTEGKKELQKNEQNSNCYINRSAPENAPIRKKLEEIIIEHIEFEDATIQGVIDALCVEAKRKDPEGKGINIVYLPKIKPVKPKSDLELFLDEVEDEEDLKPEPDEDSFREITMMFEDLSLGEAIRNICFAAELKYRVEKHVVVMADKSVPLDPLETRIYPIESEADFGSQSAKLDTGGTESVKPFFERRGVFFPDGSEIVYNDAVSRLIAKNTPEQLRRIEMLIDEIYVVDPQVLITTRLIKIPDCEFRKIKKTKKNSLYEQILLSDKSEIIASASIVTQNGEEATLRMVRDVYFPDSWGESSNYSKSDSIDDENETKKGDKGNRQAKLDNPEISTPSSPEFGEPTELGVRLTTTPTVDPDKYTITMDMIPVIQYFAGWTEFDNNIKTEIIKAWTVITQVTLYDGHTVCMGSSIEDVSPEGKRERNRFVMTVTARLIRPDGTYIRDIPGELNPVSKIFRLKSGKRISAEEKELDKVILDRIEFKDADLQKAVKALKQKTKLNMAIGMDEADLENIPAKINLDLRKIPISDVLRYLCMQTGLQYCIDDNVILIGNESIQEMYTRFFPIRFALVARIVSLPDDEWSDDEFYDGTIEEMGWTFQEPPYRLKTREGLEKYFAENLITFPEGTAVAYDRRTQKLLVKNTEKNLKLIENLLRNLDIEQPQVNIESTIVEISNKDLIALIGKKAAMGENLNLDQIEKIINSPGSRILFCQSVIAKNGEEANIRKVNETYLPNSWSFDEVHLHEGYIEKIPPVPEFGASFDMGTGFTVTPNVSPDGYTLTLSLNPQFLKFEGWSEYNAFEMDAHRKFQTGKNVFKMPIWRRNDIIQNLKVYDGKTIIAGRTQQIDISNKNNKSFNPNTSWTEMLNEGRKNGEELQNIFFFIKANIINPFGECLRK